VARLKGHRGHVATRRFADDREACNWLLDRKHAVERRLLEQRAEFDDPSPTPTSAEAVADDGDPVIDLRDVAVPTLDRPDVDLDAAAAARADGLRARRGSGAPDDR
jgi:hypothetical protein